MSTPEIRNTEKSVAAADSLLDYLISVAIGLEALAEEHEDSMSRPHLGAIARAAFEAVDGAAQAAAAARVDHARYLDTLRATAGDF